MLDLACMRRIRLSAQPLGQKVVGWAFLAPQYRIFSRVRIVLEGVENLPERPVIFAMNHTDRYNYWPFQFELWQSLGWFTAAWVKGKYYQHALMQRFMEATNNIPVVSRGYVIARDFLSFAGRAPTNEQYRMLRQHVDAVWDGKASDPALPESALPPGLLRRSREILGWGFDSSVTTYAHAIGEAFTEMMRYFIGLNEQALSLGLHMIVFPQGTRSKRLTVGYPGLAQMAKYLRRPIVPVGCSGSDRVYPGSNPISKPGRIVYRIGKPITPDEMDAFPVPTSFSPFSPDVERNYGDQFEGLIRVVMDRINDLVDPEYRFADGGLTQRGAPGAERFV